MTLLHSRRQKEIRKRLEGMRPRLYRVAFAWTHNRSLAEDLTQDTLVKALQAARQLRELESLDAWLFRIMSNCRRDHFRNQVSTENVDNYDLVDERTPETRSSEQQLIQKVRDSVEALPETHRQTLTLVDIEGFSYMETASILEIPVGTVMSRLSRARARLRKLLATQHVDVRGNDSNARLRRIK